jgi:hypothetical protein
VIELTLLSPSPQGGYRGPHGIHGKEKKRKKKRKKSEGGGRLYSGNQSYFLGKKYEPFTCQRRRMLLTQPRSVNDNQIFRWNCSKFIEFDTKISHDLGTHSIYHWKESTQLLSYQWLVAEAPLQTSKAGTEYEL